MILVMLQASFSHLFSKNNTVTGIFQGFYLDFKFFVV